VAGLSWPFTAMANIDILLLIATVALGLALAGVLLRHGQHREFPFFFTYIVVNAMGDAIKIAVIHHYAVYFYVYWSFELLWAVLGLAALYEAYYRVFRNFFRVHPWFWRLFPAAVAAVVVLSTVYALTRPPKQALWFINLIISLEIGVNLIQFAIFLLFRGAMLVFHARRRNYPLGIVNGFAVVAAAGIAYTVFSEFGTKFTFLVQYGVPVAYILAEAVWLETFLRPPEAAPQLPQGVTLEQALEEMAQSHRELKDWKDFSRKVRK
jgi:hypothetical protein